MAFTQSLDIDRSNPATWIDFAKLDRRNGNIAGALVKLRNALLVDPNEPETHVELALTYLDHKEEAKAIEHARSAKELGADLPEILKPLVADKATE